MKTSQFTKIAVSLLALGLLAVGIPQKTERYEKLVSEMLPKTVTIYVKLSRINPDTGKKQYGGILGSGVFVSNSGHVLTASHLFEHPYTIEKITVKTSDGGEYKALFVYKDMKKDLAMIKIWEINTPFAVLADPRSVREGQEVIAIGAPLGLEGSVTTGIISATHRDNIHYDMIQMSAAINPGNSGGPLFNLKGELVGINVNIMSMDPLFPSWSGLGFSVSASEINKFLSVFPDKKTIGRLSWH